MPDCFEKIILLLETQNFRVPSKQEFQIGNFCSFHVYVIYVERHSVELRRRCFHKKNCISSVHVISNLLDSIHHAYSYQSAIAFKRQVNKFGENFEIFRTIYIPPRMLFTSKYYLFFGS